MLLKIVLIFSIFLKTLRKVCTQVTNQFLILLLVLILILQFCLYHNFLKLQNLIVEQDNNNKIWFAELANKIIVMFVILILLNVIIAVPIFMLFNQMALAKLKNKPIVLVIQLIPIIVNNAVIYIIPIQHLGLAKQELSKIAKLIVMIINAQNAKLILSSTYSNPNAWLIVDLF